MIYKCPNCNGALEYDPITDLMQCSFCGSGFTVAEIEMMPPKEVVEVNDTYAETPKENVKPEDAVFEAEVFKNLGTMERRIYTCTACGAELSVSDNEAATFCAYCGQPTIVFSRVSQELKPESIVPFKISKEQAEELLKERLKNGYFIPKEIKEVKLENIRGIYIPYWLFDIYYYDIQYWEVDPHRSKSKNDKPLIYSREAECDLRGLTVDASDNLDDETSQRLEPYHLRERKPFDAAYLSGYYADKYDLGDRELYDFAVSRAKEIFDGEIRKTIPERNVEIVSSLPKRTVNKAEYTMLPAWFLTFRYQNEPYTMVINGQTGKIVGTIPYDRKKMTTLFVTVSIAAGLLALISGIIMTLGRISLFVMIFLAVMVPIVEITIAAPILIKVKKTGKLTKARKTERYAGERQDKV